MKLAVGNNAFGVPGNFIESAPTPMQGARHSRRFIVGVQIMGLAVHGESSRRNPVCVATRDTSEIGRRGDVLLKGVVPKYNISELATEIGHLQRHNDTPVIGDLHDCSVFVDEGMPESRNGHGTYRVIPWAGDFL